MVRNGGMGTRKTTQAETITRTNMSAANQSIFSNWFTQIPLFKRQFAAETVNAMAL